MKSKFEIKDNRTIGEKLKSFGQSILFWKGRKKGIIHTRDIKLDDIRAIFFPKDFYEKYHYLGSVPYKESGDLFKAIYPLVLAMDYEAKPKWCPRWFLRFLHLFGSDNSIVRVRNRTLHNLEKRLTKGFMIWDYKTKWTDYDLRISVSGTEQMQDLADSIEHKFYSDGYREDLANQMQDLADSIEHKFYSDGYREDLANQIKELDPTTKHHSGYSIDSLKTELDRLETLNKL
jgi:hypothetical protein